MTLKISVDPEVLEASAENYMNIAQHMRIHIINYASV